MKRTILVALVLLFALECVPAAAGPALYRVRGEGGGEIYLFGTIHVGTEGDGEALEGVYPFLDRCSLLLTEVDMDSLDAGNAEMLLQAARYFLPLWDSLENHLGGEICDRLAEYTGLGRPLLDRYSPVWVSAYLESLSAAEAGLDARYGTESFLCARAKEKGIENEGLEKISDQMDAALSFTDAYLKASILSYLDDPEGMRAGLEGLHAMWLAGDGEGLTAYIAALGGEEGEDARGAYESLYVSRNAVFARRCVKELERGERVMVAVGCGHLYGEDGLLRLLEEKGYAVERID